MIWARKGSKGWGTKNTIQRVITELTPTPAMEWAHRIPTYRNLFYIVI